jgi:hypothetical protein
VKPGQESCVRSSGTVTLSARGPSDSCWGRSPIDDQSHRGHQCSRTSLTGESRFHISPPRGFEPVTLVAGSKQVSPLDQWDMVRIMWDCRLSTYIYIYIYIYASCTLPGLDVLLLGQLLSALPNCSLPDPIIICLPQLLGSYLSKVSLPGPADLYWTSCFLPVPAVFLPAFATVLTLLYLVQLIPLCSSCFLPVSPILCSLPDSSLLFPN